MEDIVCNKVLRGTRYYDVESNILLVLKYYIIEKITNSGESYYGIEIEEKRMNKETQAIMRVDQFLLSECKEQVNGIIDKFIGGGVTPVTAGYVIDDLM